MAYRSSTRSTPWRPALGAAALLLAILAGPARGQATRPAGLLSGTALADGQVTLIAGRSVLLTWASSPLKRVSISDPEIATARVRWT